MGVNKNFDPALVQRFLDDYQDRGMMKWQGFMLRDHTAKLNKKAKAQAEREQRQHSFKMILEQISKTIYLAQMRNLTLKIELNEINKEHIVPPNIEGKIKGYYENKLMIGPPDQLINLNNIYAIKIKDTDY